MSPTKGDAGGNPTSVDMGGSQASVDSTVTTSDVKPLVGRVLASRTRLEWILMVVGVILGIVLIVFIAAYGHCMGMYKDLKHAAEDDAHTEPQLEGEQCSHMDGAWYNGLGSEIILNTTHGKRGFLFGEYRTAVERETGSAGESHSIVVGAHPSSRKPSETFAFSVMWRDGMSMTTWTGQCMSCDGKETLITSWMLRSKQANCGDVWKSTMVGQDVFTREPQTPGPARNMSTYQPSDELLEIMKWKPVADLDSKNLHTTGDDPCSLDGPWQSDSKNELALTHEHGTIIEGRYRNEFEHNIHLDTEILHSLVYGIGNSQVSNTTVALFVVHEGGRKVTGWTGQCHVCDRPDGGKKAVLETVWMHRTQVSTCSDNWKATLLGHTTFQRPVPT